MGVRALLHGNRRPEMNIIARLYDLEFAGFTHQHLTELLGEVHGITLSWSTVRRWCLSRRRAACRPAAGTDDLETVEAAGAVQEPVGQGFFLTRRGGRRVLVELHARASVL